MRIDDLPQDWFSRVPHLAEKLRGVDLPNPQGYMHLAIQFIRDDKIKLGSGVVLHSATATQDEDKWQGRVGLIISSGPECYKNPRSTGDSVWAQPGDWVLWPKLENVASRFSYNGVILCLIQDDRVLATGVDPAMVMFR